MTPQLEHLARVEITRRLDDARARHRAAEARRTRRRERRASWLR